MNSVGNNVLGGLNKSTPLISIYTVLDLDMAVIKYTLINLRNPQYFDLDKVTDMSYIQLVGEIYRRKYINPLYYLMKSEDLKDTMDEVYNELMEKEEYELLKLAPSTDILPLLDSFVKSGDIKPSILCYNDIEKQFLEENQDQFRGISILTFKEIINSTNNFNIYSQIYIRYWEKEIAYFKNRIIRRTFYVSTSGFNLTEDNNDLDNNNLILEVLKFNNKISLFDMYRLDIIGGYNVNDSL